MAILYYPKNQVLASRDASNPLFVQLILGMQPNTVIYFDTASSGTNVSASYLYITASLADTASYALNASSAGGVLSSYSTILTGSNNGITASFTGTPTQQVNLTRTASYTFTSSGIPSSGQVADIVLYISHSGSPNTSSLVFPATWVNIGTGFPTFILANKVALLWLRATDTGTIMGTFTPQP